MENEDSTPNKRVEMLRDKAMMYLGDATEFIVFARQPDGNVAEAACYMDPLPWVGILENQKDFLLKFYRNRRRDMPILPGDAPEA